METATDFIWLDLKLVDWLHADFVVCLRVSSPLWTLRRLIRERHTHVEHLQLFRAPAHKKNEILDFSITLQQLGFVGGPKEAGLRGVLYFNFRPGRARDPTLMRSPGLMIESDPQREAQARETLEDMGIVPPLTSYLTPAGPVAGAAAGAAAGDAGDGSASSSALGSIGAAGGGFFKMFHDS